ncbi:MAG: hypothetical protein BWY11_00623 [Firmicutes bacterium ADurb.Bin182]|nr:MAG: hypothetical protein BWY11_00623 [Firmicutes bacterium ADurb.Bin182]
MKSGKITYCYINTVVVDNDIYQTNIEGEKHHHPIKHNSNACMNDM